MYICTLIGLASIFILRADSADVFERYNDPGLATYITRPDLKPPKWDITVHRPELLTPGYWFVAPYEGEHSQAAGTPWIGPAIYDSAGELIWSGSLLDPQGFNWMDFRVQIIEDEPVLTAMSHGWGQGVIIGKDYEVRKLVDVDEFFNFNTHEFNFVEGGKTALVTTYNWAEAPKDMIKAIGRKGGCPVAFDGFREIDLATMEPVFAWSSRHNIGLDESTYGKACEGRWDHVHANSVDKTTEGDYLASARHTDAIYKISKSGEIIWRLGGKKSDFQMDFRFSRQHDIRIREQNETHLLVSILDNAKGQDEDYGTRPTHPSSRALLIAIDETNMVATIERQYEAPMLGFHAFRRGNFQVLPNGNAFVGWSEQALQSEHTPNGTLIWQAKLQTEWMGSYRNYKFDNWVGDPPEAPVVVAQRDGKVYVSWNGATEVAAWKLYRAKANGRKKEYITKVARSGFETMILFDGRANYVVVEAIDRKGKVLRASAPTRTIVPYGYVEEEEEEEGPQDPAWWQPSSEPDYWLWFGAMCVLSAGLFYARLRRQRLAFSLDSPRRAISAMKARWRVE